MINEIKELSKNENEPKRLLILTKYNHSIDKTGKILEEIKKFNRTRKVLEINDKIRIGKLKLLKGPRYDNNQNIIPYSFIGPNKIYITRRREGIKSISSLFKQNKNKQEINKTKSEIDIYSNFQKSFIKQFTKYLVNEKTKMKPIPKFVKLRLKNQEKILKTARSSEEYKIKLENIILKKTKKDRKDLLLNFSESYNSTKNFKTDELNENLKNWNFKLRNPKKNGLFERPGYYKITSLNEDLYSIFNLNHKKEIRLNPFKNNFYKTKTNILNRGSNATKNLSEIKLEGIKINIKKAKNKRNFFEIKDQNMNNTFKNRNSFSIFSYNEKNDLNLSDIYDEKILAINYNSK